MGPATMVWTMMTMVRTQTDLRSQKSLMGRRIRTIRNQKESIIDKQGSDDGSGDKNDEMDAAGESDDTSEEDNETDYSDYSVCSSQSERDMGS